MNSGGTLTYYGVLSTFQCGRHLLPAGHLVIVKLLVLRWAEGASCDLVLVRDGPPREERTAA